MFPGNPTDDGALARLIDHVDRQIAEGHLDPSAGDSAIEGYRRLAEAFPGNAATAQLGERLSAAIWSKAKIAERAERWDEAVQLYTVLKTLPPNPAAAILADQRTPAGAIDAPAAEPAATLAEAPVPDAPTGRAREIGGSTAAGSAALSVTEQRDITAVATARGDEAMVHGDVISARRFYEVAASQGSPRAMTALGRTYDPVFLQERGVRGLLADAAAARRWYQQAIDHGEAEAQARMNKLLQANSFSVVR
jgi:TPR repeat protein